MDLIIHQRWHCLNLCLTVAVLLAAGAAQAQTFVPVCDRTAEVQPTLIAAVAGKSDCSEITEQDLAGITILNFSGAGITQLQVGDLSGLSGLQWLSFISNNLTTVPSGIFAGLDDLRYLNLCINRINHLPADVFAGLETMAYLILHINQLSSLEDNLFVGLTDLQILWLDSNPGAPFDFVVRVEPLSATSARVTVDKGAPFDMTVGLQATGGTLSVQQVQIETGTAASTPFTFTEGAEVRISSLPEVPTLTVGAALATAPTVPRGLPAGNGSPAYRAVNLVAAATIPTPNPNPTPPTPAPNPTPGPSLQSPDIADIAHQVSSELLPQIAFAGTAAAHDAISMRVGQVITNSRSGQDIPVNVPGLLRRYEQLQGHSHSTQDWHNLLANTSFAQSLGAQPAGTSSDRVNEGQSSDSSDRSIVWNFWGGGKFSSLSNKGGQRQSIDQVEWDGNLTHLQLGIDAGLTDNFMVGLMGTTTANSMDYMHDITPNGLIDGLQLSLYPYMSLFEPGVYSLWAAAGYGTGEIEVSSSSTARMDSGGVYDSKIISFLAGGRLRLLTDTTRISLKTQLTDSRVELRPVGVSPGESSQQTLSRLHAAVDFSWHLRQLSGVSLLPALEIGVRQDSGASELGSGTEIGFNFSYTHPGGLTLEAGVRTLLAEESGYREDGGHALLRYQIGTSTWGGAIFSLRPSWGARSLRNSWQQTAQPHGFDSLSNEPEASGWGRDLRADWSYGFALSGLCGPMRTYSSLQWLDKGGSTSTLGSSCDIGNGFRLGIEHRRHSDTDLATNRDIRLATNQNIRLSTNRDIRRFTSRDIRLWGQLQF